MRTTFPEPIRLFEINMIKRVGMDESGVIYARLRDCRLYIKALRPNEQIYMNNLDGKEFPTPFFYIKGKSVFLTAQGYYNLRARKGEWI